MTVPSESVLDLFAVPESGRPLAGSPGSYVAGDLVLSRLPAGDDADRSWLAPAIARTAVKLDEDPRRVPGALRLAMPVPARDGSIVVDGWEAHRFEAGTSVVQDPALVRAAGRLLHAHLAVDVPMPRTVRLRDLTSPVRGEPVAEPRLEELLTRLEKAIEAAPAPPERRAQLVHSCLPGRVLMDQDGSPVVLQVVAAWDVPARAEARWLLQGVIAGQAPAGWHASLSDVQRRRALEVLGPLAVDDMQERPERTGEWLTVADLLGA